MYEDDFDVLIVGAGPAGLFAALELMRSGLTTAILDQGEASSKRECKDQQRCVDCRVCANTHGVGGSGLFSDGKLSWSPQAGGNLDDLTHSGEMSKTLLADVYQRFLDIGMDVMPNEGIDNDDKYICGVKELTDDGISYKYSPVFHLGTDRCITLVRNIEITLRNSGCEFILNSCATSAFMDIHNNSILTVYETPKGTKAVRSRYLIITTGKRGIFKISSSNGERLRTLPNRTRVGIRIETEREVLAPLLKFGRDPKLYIEAGNGDLVRTFCVCYGGEVISCRYEGYRLLGGHSYNNDKSPNSNMALLVDLNGYLSNPSGSSDYGMKLLSLFMSLSSGKHIAQRFSDFRLLRASPPGMLLNSKVRPTLNCYVAEDINRVLPYRLRQAIVEAIYKLEAICPGIAADHNIIYGLAMERLAPRIVLRDNAETSIDNVYIGGDAAGHIHGIVNAAAAGILAARGIISKDVVKLYDCQN